MSHAPSSLTAALAQSLFHSLRSLTTASALALAACGGGGSGGGSDVLDESVVPVPLVRSTETYFGSEANSGFAYESSGTILVVDGASAPIFVGDSSDDDVARGFLRMDLTGLSAGATIEDAQLTMYQAALGGTPYVDLGGALRVDHIDMGAGLDGADYASPVVVRLGIGILATDATVGVLRLDVTEAVAATHAAGATYIDLRLRFPVPTDGDGTSDSTALETPSGVLGTGEVPTLSITTLE